MPKRSFEQYESMQRRRLKHLARRQRREERARAARLEKEKLFGSTTKGATHEHDG